MELSLRPDLTLDQRLELSLKIIHGLSQELLLLKQELIETIHGLRYSPLATCPKCGKKLSEHEILTGFTNNPYDLRTTCPNCQHRFESRLRHYGERSSIYVSFMCPAQAIHGLGKIGLLTETELQREFPMVYQSCKYHFGSLKTAYKQIGIEFKEDIPWKEKVKDFLGKLPDRVIAIVVGTTSNHISKLRKSLGIAIFKQPKRKIDDEIIKWLGTAPDGKIGEQLGIPTRTICKYRNELNIPPYKK